MERQDPYGDLEREGIPELDDPPPGLEDTGGDYEAVVAPRDRPLVADDYGTTAREQRVPEPQDVRSRRELPDREMERRRQPPMGRLADDGDDDLEATEVSEDRFGLSAEEAAMHPISE